MDVEDLISSRRSHGNPAQFVHQWGDMVEFPFVAYYLNCKVLHSLKLADVTSSCVWMLPMSRGRLYEEWITLSTGERFFQAF